jgi:hypothetical protein
MNVLMQLYVNRTKCEDRLAHAENMLTQANHPFEVNRAKEALGKAQKSLDMVIREIVKEESRQDEDEINYLDS